MSQNFESFGKYILLEKIQTGGMAEIYLARKPGASGVSKFIAIKRILPQFSEQTEFIDMFKDEAKIAVNLSHANIVSIHEFGVEKSQFFLAMDYVEGRNLRQILNKMKKSGVTFSVEQVLFIIKEVAAGLDHAHRCIDANTGKPLNIIHRDMSPQNVMVSFEGEVKVVDFGIAKAETQLDSTRAGTLKGKFGYMSPEQAEGQVVDLRTDIFALGIVLWELLANDRLFVANNEINTLRKVRDCQIPSLRKINPNIPPELERIVSKALAKDRNLRYQTAAAFQRELSRFLNRQYPDFSQHDFSVFIKTLFAAEILDSRKKMVEYSKFEARLDQQNNNRLEAPRSDVPRISSKPIPNVEPPPQARPGFTRSSTQTERTGAPPAPSDASRRGKTPSPDEASRPKTVPKRELPVSQNKMRASRSVDTNGLRVDHRSYGERQTGLHRTHSSMTNAGTAADNTYGGSYSSDYIRTKKSSLANVLPVFMLLLAIGAGFIYLNPNSQRLLANLLGNSLGKLEIDHTPQKTDIASQIPTFDLNITSSPSGAEVFIDDRSIGDVTPAPTRKVPQFAEVKITLRKDGYASWEQKMKIEQSTNLKINLQAERTGKLDINVVGAGQIYVNDKLVAQGSPALDVVVPAEKEITVKAIDNATKTRDEVHVIVAENTTKKITLIPRAFRKVEPAQK